MLNLFRNKKGQNTAEYAVLIALVVAAGIAMQTYVKRGMQAGTKFAVEKLKKNDVAQGQVARGQYEPYYRESSYDITQNVYQDTVQTEADGKVTRVFGVTGDKETKRTGEEKTQGVTTQTGEPKY